MFLIVSARSVQWNRLGQAADTQEPGRAWTPAKFGLQRSGNGLATFLRPVFPHCGFSAPCVSAPLDPALLDSVLNFRMWCFGTKHSGRKERRKEREKYREREREKRKEGKKEGRKERNKEIKKEIKKETNKQRKIKGAPRKVWRGNAKCGNILCRIERCGNKVRKRHSAETECANVTLPRQLAI